MNNFKGKAIYNPSGKAGEYSYWACNFYVGCLNGCTYCYLKKGITAKVLGGDYPKLKKCFKDEDHALEIFYNEVSRNIEALQKHGLFFTFTSDPMLEQTKELTRDAIDICQKLKIPVKVLTKRADFLHNLDVWVKWASWDISLIAFGFTLTGHDELEFSASTNYDRIVAMMKLHDIGFKTFASIEPIIDFKSSKEMIRQALPYCDLFKVGLESGKKYDIIEAQCFVEWLIELDGPKIYLKESLQKLSRYTNNELGDYFVERDYNLFK